MAGTSNSITTHNVLSGVLNADNVISGLVNTAFNPAYALVTQAGAQIVLFINNNDYKMYAQLKDKSGNLIYTSNIIDLPLETMVVDGRYDSNTKKLILVLDNGNEIEVPLEALISGLVNEDDLIANYYDKDEIDALLDGYWTKIELTQEDIDNWNAADAAFQSELFDDGIISIEDSTEANINNTMNKSQLKIDLKGNTTQESTTGKNLLNVPSVYSVTGNTTINITLPAGTYYITCGNITKGGANDPYIVITGVGGVALTQNLNRSFTISSEITSVAFYSNGYNWSESQGKTSTINNLMISTSGGDYEQYTGGNPAPNPDYPSPVNVVTGDNEVKVKGKNLFDGVLENGTYTNSGVKDATALLYRNKNIISVKPETTYTFSINGTKQKYVVYFYDNTQTFISWSSAFSTGVISTPSNAYYMNFRCFADDYDANFLNLKVQLELGENATTYEPYQSQTYPITLSSKNLFSGMSSIGSDSSYENNTLTIPTSNTNISNIINVDSSTPYTLSLNSSSSSTRIYITENNANGERVNTLTSYSRPYTFTTTANTKTIDIRFSPSSSESFPITISQIMLEKGSTATGYQPYNPNPIELCKIGDYQDYITKSTGKNLFSGWTKGTTLNPTTGTERESSDGVVSDYISVNFNINSSYYISGLIETLYSFIGAYNSNNQFLGRTVATGRNNMQLTSTSFTSGTPQGTGDIAYLRVTQYVSEGGNINDIDNAQTQLEIGSTSTTYEPYGKVWYKYGAIGKLVLTGSEAGWYISGTGTANWFYYLINTNAYPVVNTSVVGTSYCDYYTPANIGTSTTDEGILLLKTSGIVRIRYGTEDTLANYKTWLSTHNTTVYYILAIPTITPITDTTLIEQLDNLGKAYSYDTQTNISQTNADKPFILDINAIADNVNGLKLENENQEYKTNKVIELSSNSTDDEYPSAKCVYDIVGNIEAVLAAMDSGSGV